MDMEHTEGNQMQGMYSAHSVILMFVAKYVKSDNI